jgi:hypothetical protein
LAISQDFSRKDGPLYQELLANAMFHEQLFAFDRDLAEQARTAGCPECGGVLHSANYPRKPRGRPMALGDEHDQRFSFCCAIDGCRQRMTPPSLRFLGRKVYLATIVTLISTMQDGMSERRVKALSASVGVDRRTVARWRAWWLDSFTATAFWQAKSATVMPPVETHLLPASLLVRFAGDFKAQLVGLLRFLGPITGGRSIQAF